MGRQKTLTLILVLPLVSTSCVTILDLMFLFYRRRPPRILSRSKTPEVHVPQLWEAAFIFFSCKNWLFYWIGYLAAVFMWILEVAGLFSNTALGSGRKFSLLASFWFSFVSDYMLQAGFLALQAENMQVQM